jgi:hypothetical protein
MLRAIVLYAIALDAHAVSVPVVPGLVEVDFTWDNATSCFVNVTISKDLSLSVGGYWVAVGLGTGMVGSCVVIARVDDKGVVTFNEYNITEQSAAGLGAPVASTITQTSLYSGFGDTGGKTVRSRPVGWAAFLGANV